MILGRYFVIPGKSHRPCRNTPFPAIPPDSNDRRPKKCYGDAEVSSWRRSIGVKPLAQSVGGMRGNGLAARVA